MVTQMQMANLHLVDKSHPHAQMVAVLNKPYDISIGYAEVPEPNDDEVRIKIKYVGICGSDLEAYRGTRAPEFISTPARLGHEIAGIVDKIGANVKSLTVGDKVTCRYVWGAFAEYIVCKPFNVLVVPNNIPMLETSLIEVFPSIMNTAQLANVDQTKNVLIMGQGVSGLLITQIMRLFSPKTLVCTDLKDKNLEMARKYGATHTYKLPAKDTPTKEVLGKDFPNGFDVIIPCLLEGDGMVDAIENAALCGKIVMYGCIGVCNKPLDFFRVHRKRLEIYSTEPKRDMDMRRFWNEAVKVISDGLVNTGEIVSKIFPLKDIQKAFDLRNESPDGIIHILLDCEKEIKNEVTK